MQFKIKAKVFEGNKSFLTFLRFRLCAGVQCQSYLWSRNALPVMSINTKQECDYIVTLQVGYK